MLPPAARARSLPPRTELAATFPAGARLYVRPLGLLHGEAAAAMIAEGKARPLAGGPLAFPACELILRTQAKTRRVISSLPEIERWPGGGALLQERLDLLSRPRPEAMARPRLMGIINVTPDSFSDAGESLDPEAAVTLALGHARAGAAILD